MPNETRQPDGTLRTPVNPGDTPSSDRYIGSVDTMLIASVWTPNTRWRAGQWIIAPGGYLATAKADFVSGASYNSANWNEYVTPGTRTGFAVNETGTSQTISTVQTAIASTSVPLPQISRPQVLRARAQVKCTTAMAATAGTVTSIQLVIVDDLGNLVDAGGLVSFDASTTNAYATVYAEYDIPANAAARTYHLEILRVGSTSGVFSCLNGALAPGFRTVLRAVAA